MKKLPPSAAEDLLEVFVRVGSKPMALVLKTFAKMAPRAI